MVVTIDGPAGSGKSSVARRVARELGFLYLDTGAMYRALTLAGLEQQWPWSDPDAAALAASQVDLQWDGQQLLMNHRDVTQRIRQEDVTSKVHLVADNPRIREHLVRLQREIADQGSVVTEGRDQGTVVFPKAQCKFFLTADPEVRARRRLKDLRAKSAAEKRPEPATVEDVLRWINDRDHRDRHRPVGALTQAADAIVVDTTDMSADEVVSKLVELARERHGSAS